MHLDPHKCRHCVSFLTVNLKAKTSQNFGNEHSTVSVNKVLFTCRDNVQVQVSVYIEYLLLKFIDFSALYNLILSMHALPSKQGLTILTSKPTLRRHSHIFPLCTLRFSLTLLCAQHTAGGGLTSPSQNPCFQAFWMLNNLVQLSPLHHTITF